MMNLLQFVQIPDRTSVALSTSAGAILTIFFKRNFLLKKHGLSCLKTATLIGTLWASTIYKTSAPLIAILTGLTSADALREIIHLSREERVKALVLSFCVCLPSMTPEDPRALSFLAVLCATTQFLRWPAELKNFLRELRIICGPAYVLLVVGAWSKSGRISSNLLLTAAASLSSFAAMFLRPDNSEVLEQAGLPVPATSTRKLVHGGSMFLSFICISVHCLWSEKLPPVYWKVAGLGALSNCLLYLGVADLPRRFMP